MSTVSRGLFVLGGLAASGVLLVACNPRSVYHDACDELCVTLSLDCELPGYTGEVACTANCEEEMDDADEPWELLDCYDDAGCSVVELIECKRLDDAGRL